MAKRRIKTQPLPPENTKEGQQEVVKIKKEKRFLAALLKPFQRLKVALQKRTSKSSRAGSSKHSRTEKTEPDSSHDHVTSVLTEDIGDGDLNLKSVDASVHTEKDLDLISLKSPFYAPFNNTIIGEALSGMISTPVVEVQLTQRPERPKSSYGKRSIQAHTPDLDVSLVDSLSPFSSEGCPKTEMVFTPSQQEAMTTPVYEVDMTQRPTRPKTSRGKRTTRTGNVVQPSTYSCRGSSATEEINDLDVRTEGKTKKKVTFAPVVEINGIQRPERPKSTYGKRPTCPGYTIHPTSESSSPCTSFFTEEAMTAPVDMSQRPTRPKSSYGRRSNQPGHTIKPSPGNDLDLAVESSSSTSLDTEEIKTKPALPHHPVPACILMRKRRTQNGPSHQTITSTSCDVLPSHTGTVLHPFRFSSGDDSAIPDLPVD